MGERPYTVQRLAEHWECSQETIYALIRKFVAGEPGGLPAFTIGGKLWRIKAEVVNQWQDIGGSIKLGSSGSERSSTEMSGDTKQSSPGETSEAHTGDNLVSSLKQRAASRLTDSLAASKP